ASYNSIKQGSGCPKCKGKSEQELREIVYNIFPNHIILDGYSQFSFLYNKETKGTQHLDILILKDDKPFCAIEYDGEQHFGPVCFGGISIKRAEQNFKNIKRLDRMKSRKIKKHYNDVNFFIRFNYREKITKEYVVSKLEDSGIDVASRCI
ncbi:hypothetical protein LCGC14_1898940, partial [marine sediment metagenome]